MGGVVMGFQRLCASDSVTTNRAATHIASWLIRQERVFSGRSARDLEYTGNSKIFAQAVYQHYFWRYVLSNNRCAKFFVQSLFEDDIQKVSALKTR